LNNKASRFSQSKCIIVRAIITTLHLSSYVNIFFSEITRPNEKKVDRDVDLIRICDIVDNAKFNMAIGANNTF
jgi:hypothetical protein